MKHIRRRRAMGVAVAGAVTATAVLAGATTAFASDSLQINVRESQMTLPRGMIGPAGTRTLHIEVAHDQDGHVSSATLTVDASGLTGIADVAWPASCTHSGAIGTCTIDHVNDVSGDQPPTFLALGLSAAAKAADGAHGTLALKATAPGLNTSEQDVTIDVGTGADLTISPLAPVNHAKVGSVLPARIRWSNTGNQTAPSTVLMIETMAGLDFTQHFSNCRYGKPSGPLKRVKAICTIDIPLAPGKSLTLTSDVKLHVTSEACYTLMTAQVLPPGPQADEAGAGDPGTPGTGPKLTATAAPAPLAAGRTTDINTNDSYTELDVRADNHAHYSAIGANADGTKGQTVPVTVGFRNNGPALIFDRSGGEGADSLKVTFPKGTTVTKVPAGCSVLEAGVKGHGPYECGSSSAYIQGPQYKAEFTFRVRLDQKLVDTRGTAALTNMNSDMEGVPVSFPWDTSTTGYTAPIVFNGPTANPTPTGTGSATASANAPGTDGTALAATGGGPTTAIAGAAALALAAGAGTLIASRRRKTAHR